MESNAHVDPLMTVQELASYTGLAAGTIYNKVSRREIPFYRLGRAVRFRRSEIDAWLEYHPVITDPVDGGDRDLAAISTSVEGA